ncbi:MAG TPA: hypothetical protein VHS58_15730, partial [Acetobacteraceae bacterium]|nr:hypothetical protein [Acetobacteraceae bacterium]
PAPTADPCNKVTQWLKPRRPKPAPRIAALAGDGDLIVDHASPRWLHKRVHDIARALARDQHYDLAQWSETGETARHDGTHAHPVRRTRRGDRGHCVERTARAELQLMQAPDPYGVSKLLRNDPEDRVPSADSRLRVAA